MANDNAQLSHLLKPGWIYWAAEYWNTLRQNYYILCVPSGDILVGYVLW